MIYYNNFHGTIVRASTMDDVIRMQSKLREADIKEVWASHHHAPETALIGSYNASTFCLTVEHKGRPVAMFGLAPKSLIDERASVWLLATSELAKIQRAFLRESRRFIDMMLEQYPLLENYVSTRNIVSIEWLRWCGAKFEEAKPYGLEGQLFHYFSFRREV